MSQTICWNDADKIKPPKGKLVRVMYSDGIECNATWAGGLIWYPEGSSIYRYVNVVRWREIE